MRATAVTVPAADHGVDSAEGEGTEDMNCLAERPPDVKASLTTTDPTPSTERAFLAGRNPTSDLHNVPLRSRSTECATDESGTTNAVICQQGCTGEPLGSWSATWGGDCSVFVAINHVCERIERAGLSLSAVTRSWCFRPKRQHSRGASLGSSAHRGPRMPIADHRDSAGVDGPDSCKGSPFSKARVTFQPCRSG